MAMTTKEFMKYVDEENNRMGFNNNWEALATAFNWREVFREDLPQNYYHPRDHFILDEAMSRGVN